MMHVDNWSPGERRGGGAEGLAIGGRDRCLQPSLRVRDRIDESAPRKLYTSYTCRQSSKEQKSIAEYSAMFELPSVIVEYLHRCLPAAFYPSAATARD